MASAAPTLCPPRAPVSVEAASGPGRAAGAVAMAIIAVAVGVVPWLYRETGRQSVNPDPFEYAQTAKEVLAGKRLYTEVWQDKPPLAIVAYALPQLFRARSYRAITFYHGICLALQGLMFAWIFRRRPATAVCCVLLVTLLPMSYWDFVWPSTEHFSNLFISANLLLAYVVHRDGRLTAGRCAAWGILACLAFQVRQTAVLCGLIPAVSILLAEASWRRKAAAVAQGLAGGLACLALILLLVYQIGSLPGYWRSVFGFAKAYVGGGSFYAVRTLLEQFYTSGLVFPAVLFAGLALGRDRWIAAAALLVGLTASLLPMRPFAHYWMSFLPYLTLLMAIGVSGIEELRPRMAWAFAGAVGVLVSSATWMYLAHIEATGASCQTRREIANAVDALAPPGSTLWCSGPMISTEPIQFFSKLPTAHPYWVCFQLDPPWSRILPRKPEAIFADYLARPPDVLVYNAEFSRLVPPAGCTQLLMALVQRYPYRKAAELEGHVIAIRQKPGAEPRIRF